MRVRQKYALYFVILFAQAGFQFASAQVSGKVVIGGHSHASSVSLSGAIVSAYGNNGSEPEALLAQAISDENGQYYLDIPAGKRVRVVFSHQDFSSSTYSVRYLQSPRSNLDWTATTAESDTVYAAAPVYIQGKGNDSTYSLVAVSLTGNAALPAKKLATSGLTGALWGVAYDKRGRQLFSSAFSKRHVGYGILGTGGIYRTDWQSGKTYPYLDLQALGIPTGADHHGGLSGNELSKSRDSLLINDVGRISLGGMAIGADNRLYLMNLHNKTLYGIRIPADTSARPTAADIESFPVPVDGCKGGDCRPFAVTAYQGLVYIGTVCDAAKSGKPADLKAFVYQLDPKTREFKPVFTCSLDYPRGEAMAGLGSSQWNAWTDDFRKALNSDFPSFAHHPQPVLSSIAFDQDGSMILGIMDRFGHLSGVGQPDPEGKMAVNGITAGDIIRVARQDKNSFSGRRFKLEADGSTGTFTSKGRGNLQGPAGGEFFFRDGFYEVQLGGGERIIREETANGSVAVLPRTGEILSSAHEPDTTFNTAGIRAFYRTNGQNARSWDFFSNAQPGTFGKANGIGGIEVISGEADSPISGRVWLDLNQDNFQDIEEPGMGNIPVELWENESRLAVARSDQDGHYQFEARDVPAGAGYQVSVNTGELGMKTTAGRQPEGIATIHAETRELTPEYAQSWDFGLIPTLKLSGGLEIENPQLLVYPNPVSDQANLKVTSKASSVEIKIIDTNGKLILQESHSPNPETFSTSFDTRNWPSGSYIITIREKGSDRMVSSILLKQ
ncbi:hypothetical protein GCM10023091_07940 [Ravibacter arvi]|uniref:Secretion system C-terminal sorting domain-containing protein n=1 Tax=Ravibacter arvi TaxID=2051041 RepID=A0ABP8LST0_9BACT